MTESRFLKLSISAFAISLLLPCLVQAQNFPQTKQMNAGGREDGSFPPDFAHGQGYPPGPAGVPYQPAGSNAPGMMPGNQSFLRTPQSASPAYQSPLKAPSPQEAARVYQWFLSYDEIRRRAQMNPIEKQQADALLARGFGLFMPGQDKLAARQLLSGLVMRYQSACQSLMALPLIPETRQLQEMYFQYFDNAMKLFSDYLKVQENVFAVDNTGQSIAKQLIQRKLALESLEHACKDLDARMRQAYGVPVYQY